MNKSKQFIALVLVVLSTVGFMACNKITGEGPIVTQELDINYFTGVSNNTSNNVSISYGEVQKVMAKGEVNIIDRIKTSVDDEVWDFELESGNYSNYSLSIEITMPMVDYIGMNGSGKIEANAISAVDSDSELTLKNNGSGRLTISNFSNYTDLSCKLQGSGAIQLVNFLAQADDVTLETRGSGDISIKNSEIIADELEIESSGSGDVYIESSELSIFTEAEISSNGSGSINLLECTIKDCNSNQNGSGNVRAHVTDKLDVTINGSGDFRYTGSPTVSSQINGSGNVSPL